MSREPFITPVTPSFVDDTVAPPGKHVVHLFGGHAPYTLKEGDWTTRKDELVRNVMRVIDEHAPGFSSGVIDMQVLTPPDIEAKIGSPHGHIFHGELQIDQLFWARPGAALGGLPHADQGALPMRLLRPSGRRRRRRRRLQRRPRDPAGPPICERRRPAARPRASPSPRSCWPRPWRSSRLGFVAPLIRLAVLSVSAPAGPLAAYRELATVDVYRLVLQEHARSGACRVCREPRHRLRSRLRADPARAGLARHRSSLASCCPLWISVLVRTFSWMLILESNGPLNRFLMALGDRRSSAASAVRFSGRCDRHGCMCCFPMRCCRSTRRSPASTPPCCARATGSALRARRPSGACCCRSRRAGLATAATFTFLLSLGFFVTPALLGGPSNTTIPMLIDSFVNDRLDWPLAAAASMTLLAMALAVIGFGGAFRAHGALSEIA